MKKAVVVLMSMLFAMFSPGGMASPSGDLPRSAQTPERVQTPDWQKSWSETLAAARKEGKVVVTGPPDTEVRKALPAVFKARYGITLEYLGGRSEMAARLRTERNAGVYTADVVLAGTQTMATILHPEKMIDPIKPVLILPEVVDASKWKNGKLWFMDPEQQYVLRLANTVGHLFHINTSMVKPGELRSARDLLDPKWKGKIALMDPTVAGSGSVTAMHLYVQAGEEFVKRLYVDQKPVISRDSRQLVDWLAHGTYPIVFNAGDDEVEKLRKDGMQLLTVNSLPDLPGSVSAGYGLVALLKNTPHPNAARIFVNWIASKEGQETYAHALGVAPTRNDIDALRFMPAERIPRPEVKYFDNHDWEFTVTTTGKIRLWLKGLLGR